MQKKILLTILISISMVSVVTAQCKRVKEKKDPFSQKIEKTASITLGSVNVVVGGVKWLMEFTQQEGNTTIKLSIAMQGELNQVVASGTEFLLRTADGEVISLSSEGDSRPVTQALSGGSVLHVFSTYVISYPVNKEQLGLLSKSVLTDIKVDIPNLNIKNPNISKKQKSNIMDVTACLATSAD